MAAGRAAIHGARYPLGSTALRHSGPGRYPTRPPWLTIALRTWALTSWPASTPTGGPPTTCRSARSTCSTTRCSRSRSGRSTSSRGCSATGARRPGLNLIYAHLNRVIRERDLDMIYITGPGHGGPGLVANAYLEGTYSEVYPSITRDEDGHAAAVPAVLVPGRHPEPRGAGDARARSTRAASSATRSRTPTARRSTTPTSWSACVVGDGEAETGPLATSWHSNKFLNPATDGAVLPILHLNGYKIANPTVLARIPQEELAGADARATATSRGSSRATIPRSSTRRWPRPSTRSSDEIHAIQKAAREGGATERPRWPMIVLKTPKGWTGPEGGRRQAGRGHLALAPGAAERGPRERRAPGRSSRPGCAATGPRSCSTRTGRSSPELAALPPGATGG